MFPVLDLLKEMIAEEEDLMSKMKLRTQEYQAELEQLCKDLSTPLKEVINGAHLIFFSCLVGNIFEKWKAIGKLLGALGYKLT